MRAEQYFWLIELIAWWEGRVCSRHLSEFFGLSRQQASKYLSEYRRRFPESLAYSESEKRFIPTDGFTPRWISGDVTEYLDWMTGQRPVSTSIACDFRLPLERLKPPPRTVTPDLIRPLIKAIREQRRIEVDYVSVSNPNREGRIIVPHTFVNTGLRWHLRAYCEKHGEYRDFVLSRFRGEPELLDPSPHGAGDDQAWNTEVRLVLQPDPRLSEPKREALAHDYGMQNGRLELTTRAALAQYLLQELRVNVKMLDGKPEAQQLVLVNHEELKPWLFNG